MNRRVSIGFPLTAIILLLTAAAAAQQPQKPVGGPEFAVSTTRSYLPGEQPKVAVYYRGLNTLDFRVYRAQDPVALFSRLKNSHQFGQGRQELLYTYREATAPIETVHNFKRDLRQRIKDFFRHQLSRKTRDALLAQRQPAARPQRVVLNASSFAAVPLLNPNRLAVSWREMLPFSWDSQRAVLPVDLKEPGVYLVEAVNGRLTAYAVLVVSELAVVTKSAPQQMLVFTTNRRTGKPAGGADLVLYREGERLAAGRADGQGLFLTSLRATGAFEPGEAEEPNAGVLVMAQTGNQFAVSSLEQYEMGSGSLQELRGYLYTDRPVYRPGHKVQFKGILRQLQKDRYRVQSGEVTVQILGPGQSPVFNQTYRLNQYGSFSGSYEIPEEPTLGTYTLQVNVDGKSAGLCIFRIEEYRKPEFEVKVTVERPQYLQGERIRASISARYYFGAPVSSAKVKYVVLRSRYVPPFWMEYMGDEDLWSSGGASVETESGTSDYERRYYSPPEQILEQEAQLDAEGKLQIELPTEVDKQRENHTYRVEARVTDAGDREVAGAHYTQVLYSDVGVFGHTDRYIYSPGDNVEVTFRALDQQGRPLQGPMQVALLRRQWVPHRYQETELQKTQLATDASGIAKFTFHPSVPGDFIVRADIKDSRGRLVSGQAWCLVWNERYVYGGGEEISGRIQMVPDKKKYKVGETARVLLTLPQTGAHVLVTAEGQQVYSAWVREAKTRSITVEVPIRPNMSPNFYIAAAFVKDNKLYEGTRNIPVPADEKKLTVEVSSDRNEYRPGQDAVYTVTVRDAAGRPVAGEVSLGIVDEAIYAVRSETAPDIFRFFYSERYTRVITRYSTYYYFYGYSGEKRMELVFQRRPYQLSDFKEEGEAPVRVRKRFLDTAYWSAHVVTDASGRAQVRLAMPDNLTTWRATARAVTADTRIGSSVQKVLARKNLMLRLETPRFFTQRDSAVVVGVVHNYLRTAKSVKVSLEGTGIEVADGAPRAIKVAQNGQARILWRVKAPATGEARFLARALSDEESDALELRVPVRPYGLPVTIARSGSVSGDGTVTERIPMPGANQESSTLRLDLAPSAAGTLLSALEYLTTFPYGCVEQTMSSFLPNVVVARTVKDLRLPPLAHPEQLDRKVKSGLKRLYGFQHQDGGWGWWTDDATHPFMTAYVIYGLREAQLAGYEVQEDVLQRGLVSLAKQLASPNGAGNETRVYMAYALLTANPKVPAPLDPLLEARAQLSPLGKALLALALAARKDPRAMELAGELERIATVSDGEVHWSSQMDPMLLHGRRENSIQASAMVVKALAGLRPDSPLLPRAVRWLIQHRRGGYYWDTTLTTATVIYGITDYLRTSKELEPSYQLEVLLNGKPLLTRTITRAEALKLQPISLKVTADQLVAGDNELEIRKRGPGVLYWSAVATQYSGGENIPATERADLSIRREYFRIVSEKRGDRYIYREEPFQGPVRVGDLVSVRLHVTGKTWEYLMIEDPLPAGFESVERDDLFQFESAPDWYASHYWTRRELHDDRVSFFQTTLWGRNEVHYRYLLRASTAGDFRVMPARVQPMYQPEVQATTSNTRIAVRESQ